MEDKVGIELIKKNPGVTVTIGETTIEPQGRPMGVRFKAKPAHVYVAIDTSGSMAGNKLQQAVDGILDFARSASNKGYDIGLIGFSSHAVHICVPTSDIESLKDCLGKMQAAGSTNMAEAIAMAHEHLAALKDIRIILLATDGQPDNAHEALNAAEKARADGMSIITIGTDDADITFLRKLATRTELGIKVSASQFSIGISSASSLLPMPKACYEK